MGTPPKIENHVYLLVNFIENKFSHYKVVEFMDVVGCNGSTKLDDQVYVKFVDKTRLCKILMTSNDDEKLKAVLSNVENYYNSLHNTKFQQKSSPRMMYNSPIPHTPLKATYLRSNELKVPVKVSTCKYPIMSEDCRRNKMFILGGNGTAVAERFLSRILWNDYKSVINDLLNAVFSEEALASYALARKKKSNIELNPSKMQDIISIVMDKCRVKRWDVLEAITKRLNNLTIKRRLYKETI